jgi:glycosyltransferase involved in cell wall biosynthesis
MTALAAFKAVEPRYFYGFHWSDELRMGAPAAVVQGKGIAQRWLPFAWEASRAVQGAIFALRGAAHFDLYHEPTYLLLGERIPAVVTVHDLSFVHYPEAHPAGRVRMLDRRLPRSLERARAVITDSEAVRDEIIKRYGIHPEKIRAIPLGVSSRFRPRTTDELSPVLRRFDLVAGGYLLSVGTLEPRKNLVRAVRAYLKLPARLRKRFPLVVVGARGWHESETLAELAPLVRSGEARVLDYVDAGALTHLYAGAAGVVYPSLYEGFGLPIAEAMASGVPTLTSRVGCMRELANGAAILVDPTDVADIALGLERLLEDPSERERARHAGLARARELTWHRCAEQTLAVYRHVLHR